MINHIEVGNKYTNKPLKKIYDIQGIPREKIKRVERTHKYDRVYKILANNSFSFYYKLNRV